MLADEPRRLSMLIAPLTMLCTTDWQAPAVAERRGHFDELRDLCDAAGDKGFVGNRHDGAGHRAHLQQQIPCRLEGSHPNR